MFIVIANFTLLYSYLNVQLIVRISIIQVFWLNNKNYKNYPTAITTIFYKTGFPIGSKSHFH